MGANPVHLYFVENAGEVWSHSDTEGVFYVISVADVTQLNATVPVSSRLTTQLGAAEICSISQMWPDLPLLMLMRPQTIAGILKLA